MDAFIPRGGGDGEDNVPMSGPWGGPGAFFKAAPYPLAFLAPLRARVRPPPRQGQTTALAGAS